MQTDNVDDSLSEENTAVAENHDVLEEEGNKSSESKKDDSTKDNATADKRWAPDEGNSPRQIKDRFFRAMLEDSKISREMIESRLPVELASRCQWQTLKMESTHIYADTFKEQIADAILSVTMKSKRDLHLIVHFEHLSAPKRWITLNFRRFREQYYYDLVHNKKVNKLPLVYPIMVYQSSQPFPYSADFYDLFEDPELARKYLDKPIDILNVCEVPDDEADRHPYAAFLELTLKHTVARTDDANFEEALRETLVPIVRKLYQEDHTGFEKPMHGFMRYLFATAPFTDKEKLANIVSEIDQQAGGTMLSLAEHIREESLAEGISQGIKQGLDQGIAQGIDRGIAQGLDRGIAQGLDQGIAQGIDQGIEEEKRRIVLTMLQKGRQAEEVADLTDQPLSMVKDCLKILKKKK